MVQDVVRLINVFSHCTLSCCSIFPLDASLHVFVWDLLLENWILSIGLSARIRKYGMDHMNMMFLTRFTSMPRTIWMDIIGELALCLFVHNDRVSFAGTYDDFN